MGYQYLTDEDRAAILAEVEAAQRAEQEITQLEVEEVRMLLLDQ